MQVPKNVWNWFKKKNETVIPRLDMTGTQTRENKEMHGVYMCMHM